MRTMGPFLSQMSCSASCFLFRENSFTENFQRNWMDSKKTIIQRTIPLAFTHASGPRVSDGILW